jgi:transposase InsO family protein
MLVGCLTRLKHLTSQCVQAVRTRLIAWTKPASASLAGSMAADMLRNKQELVLENALLRQQLIILSRTTKRPALTAQDRGLLVLLASRLRSWASALVIVKPETVLGWHRQGFRLFWRHKSGPRTGTPRIPAETVELIKQMAVENRLGGAERIRGELLKLDIRVSKRTIQKYMKLARPPRKAGQTWATFVRNHAHQIWACDFLQVTALFFRHHFAFFIIELSSRQVIHVGVTHTPTGAWHAQQLREATPYDERPRFLIRDNDGKYGPGFDQLAAASGMEVLRTPVQAPRANAFIERFLGSVRRECLDHVLILTEAQLRRVLRQYVAYFNEERPHQSLAQRVPLAAAQETGGAGGKIIAAPILGGLHHAYRRAA